MFKESLLKQIEKRAQWPQVLHLRIKKQYDMQANQTVYIDQVKGIERFLGTLETQTQELMETSSGLAKYEHQHKAIVWRVPRLPKQGQGSYTNHEFVYKLQLSAIDQMPEQLDKVSRFSDVSIMLFAQFWALVGLPNFLLKMLRVLG